MVGSGPELETTSVVILGPELETTMVVGSGPEDDTATVVTLGPELETTRVVVSGPEEDSTTVVGSGPEDETMRELGSGPVLDTMREVDMTTVVGAGPKLEVTTSTVVVASGLGDVPYGPSTYHTEYYQPLFRPSAGSDSPWLSSPVVHVHVWAPLLPWSRHSVPPVMAIRSSSVRYHVCWYKPGYDVHT